MSRRLFITAALATVLATGCCKDKCCFKKDCRPGPPPPSGPIMLPPAGVPTAPLPSPPAGGALVPSVGPMDLRNYPPPPVVPGPSYKPPAEVLLPDPLPGTARNSSAGAPGIGVQSPVKATAPVVPVVPAGMTGLPGFAKVKEGLATGRKPDLDGFASLQRAGYRTVIYLHAAETDISAVRDLAGKRDLAFIPIEIKPEELTAALGAFNTQVADKSIRPTYVFDDDGVRTGAMWYLHFRSAMSLTDDVARVRAKPLGLTDRGPEAQAFGLAIQRYLEER